MRLLFFDFKGDCNNRIHLWEPSSETWNVDMSPFVGHTASVEDLQVYFLSGKQILRSLIYNF